VRWPSGRVGHWTDFFRLVYSAGVIYVCVLLMIAIVEGRFR
jgi:hypothetical protein